MTELDDYDYQLPHDLIAQQPLAVRSDARLLLVDRSSHSLDHAHVRDLPSLLRPGDCLVINNSQVIPARLVGRRTETGGRWQGLFVDEGEQGTWRLMCKTRGKLVPGVTVTLLDRRLNPDVSLRMLTPLEDGQWAARPESGEPAATVLERVGRVPLPHYIRDGQMLDADWQDYQTVFAKQPGSVAAPTAGLHFTDELLARLVAAGVRLCQVTLHVGPGTFRPISVSRLSEHHMHCEWGMVDAATIQQLRAARNAGTRVVAVGTTTTRLLETAAAGGQLQVWQGRTDLFIRPPYQFRAIDALMTNFHLPRSTLLILVRTFGGDALMRRAYGEAIRHRYRFYSYGDAMLIL